MREILFRGKTAGGKWIYGSLVHRTQFYGDPCDEYLILVDGEFHCDYYDADEVVTETIGQFTGMTDKNGTKIFEGDITRELDGGMDGIPRMVRWDEDRMEFKCPLVRKHWCYGYNDVSIWLMQSKNTEVIGNIHDNPELLEVDDG